MHALAHYSERGKDRFAFLGFSALLYRSYKVIIFVAAAKCFICVLSRPIRAILPEKGKKTRGLFVSLCLSVVAAAAVAVR